MLTKNFPRIAEAVLAAGAIVAGAVAQSGVEEHAGAHRVPAGAGTVRRHHAGAVGPADMGERDLWDGAVTGEQIHMVERRRPERDQHLAGPRLRRRRVLVAQHLRPPVPVESNRFHRPNQLSGAVAFAESNADA